MHLMLGLTEELMNLSFFKSLGSFCCYLNKNHIWGFTQIIGGYTLCSQTVIAGDEWISSFRDPRFFRALIPRMGPGEDQLKLKTSGSA